MTGVSYSVKSEKELAVLTMREFSQRLLEAQINLKVIKAKLHNKMDEISVINKDYLKCKSDLSSIKRKILWEMKHNGAHTGIKVIQADDNEGEEWKEGYHNGK